MRSSSSMPNASTIDRKLLVRRLSMITKRKLQTSFETPIGPISRAITARLRPGGTAGDRSALCRSGDAAMSPETCRNSASVSVDPDSPLLPEGLWRTSFRRRKASVPRSLASRQREVSDKIVHQRRVSRPVKPLPHPPLCEVKSEFRRVSPQIAPRDFGRRFDLGLRLLLQPRDLAAGCFFDPLGFLLHLRARLSTEVFDVGPQPRHPRVHLAGAFFRLRFDFLSFANPFLNFRRSRSEERRHGLRA